MKYNKNLINKLFAIKEKLNKEDKETIELFMQEYNANYIKYKDATKYIKENRDYCKMAENLTKELTFIKGENMILNKEIQDLKRTLSIYRRNAEFKKVKITKDSTIASIINDMRGGK